MLRKLFLFWFVVSMSVAAFAGIQFSGSGPSGTISPGQPFNYNFDGNNDWGSPGVGNGLGIWNGPTLDGFTITFDLPTGVSIDPNNLGSECLGGASGGTVFCASPYTQPWTVTSLTSDSITFMAQSGGDLLANDDSFFVNIFFTGDPNGASFSGEWVTQSTPEPASLLLFGSGLVGLAAIVRRKMR